MPDATAPPVYADRPTITRSRSIAKAVTWRIVGSLDTLFLSWALITWLGPMFGLEHTAGQAAKTAGLIAATEVVTKILLYYLHERWWEWLPWGTRLVNGKRRETHWRSVAKTASWRMTASLDTMLLAFLFTGNVATAISIGGMEVMTKLLLYFLHERAWSNIGYGIVGPVGDEGSAISEPFSSSESEVTASS